MAAKLKTDENLPETAAAVLRAAGHDVTTVLDEELGGAADPRVAAVCQTAGRALLTLDRGLGEVQDSRQLRAGQPGEEAQLDDARLERVEHGQARQRRVQGEHLVGPHRHGRID